jgi:hypothetical protein
LWLDRGKSGEMWIKMGINRLFCGKPHITLKINNKTALYMEGRSE